MQPEYTNTITTIRHPHFGSLRLIHLDGQPWICLTDISRILKSTASSKTRELLTNPEVEHASGRRFLRLDLPLAWLTEPRDAFLDWLLSIVLSGGRIGPTPFREHPGPHLNVVANLTLDASWLYAFTDPSTPYDEWLRNRTGQIPAAGSAQKAKPLHFPNGRTSLVTGAKELIRAGNLEMSWVAKMVVTEAMNGWHTQDSLDHAMTQCAELLPDPPDRIDTRAVHAFLEIIESFPVWINECIYRQELLRGKDYFTSDASRFLPTDEEAASEVHVYFTVETAKDLMMQARTPRGSSTRQYFIEAAKREGRREILNLIEKVFGKASTALE